MIALAGEDLLRRIGDEVDHGKHEIEYKGLCFEIEDDEKGWTYRYREFVGRNLNEMLLHLEALRQGGR